MDKPKREAILDLSKYANQRIRVKFTGGREGMRHSANDYVICSTIKLVTGVLKGFDQLLNLVLDEVEETLVFGKNTVLSCQTISVTHRENRNRITDTIIRVGGSPRPYNYSSESC